MVKNRSFEFFKPLMGWTTQGKNFVEGSVLVVGDREQQSGQVSVRNRKHGDQGAKSVDGFLAEIEKLIAAKAPSE